MWGGLNMKAKLLLMTIGLTILTFGLIAAYVFYAIFHENAGITMGIIAILILNYQIAKGLMKK